MLVLKDPDGDRFFWPAYVREAILDQRAKYDVMVKAARAVDKHLNDMVRMDQPAAQVPTLARELDRLSGVFKRKCGPAYEALAQMLACKRQAWEEPHVEIAEPPAADWEFILNDRVRRARFGRAVG